ncbi:hypothetical protein HVA01_33730 [Halovibrio variabilis]|uniref:Uncharacterized protein n=1 Tax=Halovibrio variabilis TaxID=31910 RepID=A0A511USZ6_9GAMM|nr:hypothetical protein HVA01_33730 [Halovibrio variabilis]
MNTQKASAQQNAWVAPQLNVMSVRETYQGATPFSTEAIVVDVSDSPSNGYIIDTLGS